MGEVGAQSKPGKPGKAPSAGVCPEELRPGREQKLSVALSYILPSPCSGTCWPNPAGSLRDEALWASPLGGRAEQKQVTAWRGPRTACRDIVEVMLQGSQREASELGILWEPVQP